MSTETIDGQEIDTANRFMVSLQAGKVVILNPPRGKMSKADAMVFAAWIVALGDDGTAFEAARNAVESV